MWSRRGVIASGAVIAALSASGCAQRSGTPLRVAITGKGASDTRLLLEAAGLVPGFPIQYSEFQSGHLVIEALNSDAIDFGGSSEIPPVFAVASAVQSFLQVGVLHGDVNNQAVLVPKGSPIGNLRDLKGKRVGYVRATTSQYFLIQMLRSVGLSWSDIEPVALTVSDGAAAFSQGALDAWAIYGYVIQRAVTIEGATVLRTALGFLSGNYPVLAHRNALANREKAARVLTYMQLMSEGYAWARLHQDKWAALVAAEIGVSVPFVQDQLRRESSPFQLKPVTREAIRSQQAVADVFTQAGLIPKPVDVARLWDARFNSDIMKGR
ncbi:aliphatic sulfonate ABC transporter substrate-binding protein [Novosphingobium barchaimii]|nr:aliphatic sulfonate ABC transporter substrate-binding protein [Novosphingobium barchaimii]